MMPHRLFLGAAMALMLAAFLDGANAACPSFATKASIRKMVVGGKMATLTLKVTNQDSAAVTDAGLSVMLPNGVTYHSVRVSPKLATAPTFEQGDGMIAWTDLRMDGKKTRTFRIKLAFDKCAGGDPVPSKHTNGKQRQLASATSSLFDGTLSVATFTGPVDTPSCLVYKDVAVRTDKEGRMMMMMNRFAKKTARRGSGIDSIRLEVISFRLAPDFFKLNHAPADQRAPPKDRHKLRPTRAPSGSHGVRYPGRDDDRRRTHLQVQFQRLLVQRRFQGHDFHLADVRRRVRG